MSNYIKRKQEIDRFLKDWASFAKENPNFDFTSEEANNLIYSSLIHIGISKEELKVNLKDKKSPTNFTTNKQYSKDVSIDSPFNNWLEYYDKNPKIDVFVSPDWTYFCQFISRNRKAINYPDTLKVYVPLDSNHIEEGAKKIFDFLTENNISHLSKISKSIRFDGIVIRTHSRKGVEKLLDFIEKDKYIQEGLINPNPFSFNMNNVAITCDGCGYYSYNETIRTLICLYIDHMKKTNNLNKVGYQSFIEYVANTYKKQFINKENTAFGKTMDYVNRTPSEKRIARQIMRLIIKSQNPEFTFEDLVEHYKHNLTQETRGEDIEDINEVLRKVIEIMSKRFNSTKKAIINIRGFLETADTKYIPNVQNLREYVIRTHLYEKINVLLEARKKSLIEYIDYYGLNPGYHM